MNLFSSISISDNDACFNHDLVRFEHVLTSGVSRPQTLLYHLCQCRISTIDRLENADLRYEASSNPITLHRTSAFCLRNTFELLYQSDQFSERFLDLPFLFPLFQGYCDKRFLDVKERTSVLLTLMTVKSDDDLRLSAEVKF